MSMNIYDDEVLRTFLDHQLQLFPEPVAETLEEADEFLDDCMATVVDNADEAMEYLGDNMDITDLTEKELEETPEVFALEDGRYLIVEG